MASTSSRRPQGGRGTNQHQVKGSPKTRVSPVGGMSSRALNAAASSGSGASSVGGHGRNYDPHRAIDDDVKLMKKGIERAISTDRWDGTVNGVDLTSFGQGDYDVIHLSVDAADTPQGRAAKDAIQRFCDEFNSDPRSDLTDRKFLLVTLDSEPSPQPA